MFARCVLGFSAALAAGCTFDNPGFLLASGGGVSGSSSGDASTAPETTGDVDPTTTDAATGETTTATTTTAMTATTATVTSDVTSDGSTTEPVGLCGDGSLDPGEECDDQNLVGGDACEANCHALFAAPKIFDFGPGEYRDVEAGDFDDDGLLDLVAARESKPGAPVLHNEGGTFGPGGEFPLPFQPWLLHTAPLTENPGDDLVVAPLFGNAVGVKYQAGGGNYDGVLGIVEVSGAFPPGVQLGDLDGNGRLDLVVPVPGFAKVAVALGKQDGFFAAPTAHSSGKGVRRFKLATLDADPALDLVGVYSDNFVSYSVVAYNFYGDQPQAIYFDNLEGASSDVVVAEIGEPDGKPELIFSDYALAEVRIYEQVAGKYVEVAWVPVGGAPNEIIAVALRGSGSPDLITLNSLSGSVSVVSTIDGVIDQPVLNLQAFEVGVYVAGMAVADLDGDGFQDIAVIEPKGRVAVFFNQSGL